MGNLGSLLFYIILFSTSSIFYYLYNKYNKNRLLLVLSFIIPMIIGGFRYKVGTDYVGYEMLYDTFKNYKLSQISLFLDLEVSFIIISIFSKYFGGKVMMFFIYNFLILFFTYKSLENIDKKCRPLALFGLLFLYFTISFNGIRQMLAVMIIYNAYKYIKNKNLKLWILNVILAALFHKTALLLAPLYFFCKIKSILFKILIVCIILILVLNYSVIFKFLSNFETFDKYSKYETYSSNYAFNNYNFYLSLMVLLYILIYSKILIKADEDNLNVIYIFIIGVLINYIGFISPDLKRFSLYFKIFEINLLSQIPFICIKPINKKLTYIITVTYPIMCFIIYYYILQQSNIIPYRFIGI